VSVRARVAVAGADRQPRVPDETPVDVRQAATKESAAAIARHRCGMAARVTEPQRQGERLPIFRSIVHDGDVFTSEQTTRGIRVSVLSEYAPDRSRPPLNQWFFLYTITITNDGTETVQLISRHWIITDANGLVEEVRGPGVVGQQPVLAPGESFTYTSGCPLRTPFGTMEGTYQMVSRAGDSFDVRIPAFTLSEPYTVH
jgi:ApaG protein